jgi:hypothetical protein
VIVTEANAEARKVLRDAITEKEQLMGDVHRVQALLRSALAVVDEAPATGSTVALSADMAEPATAATTGDDPPGWSVTSRGSQSTPVSLPPAVEQTEGIRKLAG